MRFSESEHDKNWRNGRVEWLGKRKERFRWEMAPAADAVVSSCPGPTGCYVRAGLDGSTACRYPCTVAG